MAKLSEIVAGLEELRQQAKSTLWINPESKWCVTFEARDSSTKGAPFWLQVIGNALNMQYLDDDEPIRRLSEEVTDFPKDFKQVAWDLATYATFDMPQSYSAELPKLIDRIARQYYALQPDYLLTYVVEDYG
jgi:hypothetical protein